MDKRRLLQRFLEYVKIDTTAREGADSYPSSPGQIELGALLVKQLIELGIDDARQDAHGIVLATLPGTVAQSSPVIALCAHLDTSPETSGKDVRPQVIENYAGGDITLPGGIDRAIRQSDNPELADLIGKTIITSDGSTLLGGDDKAGLAVIMETVAWLVENPHIEHGPLRICFTCDEEVGRGTDHLDLDEIGAVACYTLDGPGNNSIDVETFSADVAEVSVRGVNIHPSIAKDRMINAVRLAADFISRLPRELSPEATEDRDGFLHPYEMSGGVGEVKLRVLLRDFDSAKLEGQAKLLRDAAEQAMAEFPGSNIDVVVTRQYRNMAEGLDAEPRAVEYAQRALERLGRTGQTTIIRGGTDGSRLTELGLPTPNLSSGQHTPHSAEEWACLEQMVESSEWLVSLAEVWAGRNIR